MEKRNLRPVALLGGVEIDKLVEGVNRSVYSMIL